MTPSSSPVILLVEDNNGDVELFKEALDSRDDRVHLERVGSVDDGIRWLGANVLCKEPITLCLIILDLHMPGKNGKCLLNHIHENPDLSLIPTVVLSSSLWQKDIDECAALGALHYRAKPFDWQGFAELMEFLKQFWSASCAADKNREHG
jgi:CheY-like chemotaxis protein